MTILNGDALFNGQGLFSNVVTLNLKGFSFNFAATSSLSALGIKPPNRMIAMLSGHGSVIIIMTVSRLVATASFVGHGRYIERSDLTPKVLSTKITNRMSFPTFPNPGDPFMRRPSKDYNNYSLSVRFTGSGRIRAIAS